MGKKSVKQFKKEIHLFKKEIKKSIKNLESSNLDEVEGSSVSEQLDVLNRLQDIFNNTPPKFLIEFLVSRNFSVLPNVKNVLNKRGYALNSIYDLISDIESDKMISRLISLKKIGL